MLISIYQFREHIKQLPKTEQARQLESARVILESPERTHCEHCKQLKMFAWSKNRKYCNNACKQKAYRARKNHGGRNAKK